jgi:hypothetical protein
MSSHLFVGELTEQRKVPLFAAKWYQFKTTASAMQLSMAVLDDTALRAEHHRARVAAAGFCAKQGGAMMTPMTDAWDELEALIDWNLVERNRDAIAKSYARPIIDPPFHPGYDPRLFPIGGEQ